MENKNGEREEKKERRPRGRRIKTPEKVEHEGLEDETATLTSPTSEEEGKVEETVQPSEGAEKKPVVVITGACGFIGSHTVELAKQEGWKVRACDLPSALRGRDEFGRSRYPELVKSLADEFAEVDITKPETLRGLFDDVDYVFHVAAILKYDVPWEFLYDVNVIGTKNIFEEILRSKNSSLKRVVIWSTNGIYGVPKNGASIITEESPVRPVTKYALSKFLEEKVATMYHRRYGVPITIIRPTAVYGPRESYMFYSYLKTMKNLKLIAVFSNFDFAFPSVHVVDVARAAIHLSKLKEAEGEDYMVDDDSGNTVLEIMKFFAETFDKPFYVLPPVPIGFVRAGLISMSYLFKFLSDTFGIRKPLEEEFSFMFGYSMRYSNQKLKSTGFQFKYPKFQEGMKETIKWYKEVGLL